MEFWLNNAYLKRSSSVSSISIKLKSFNAYRIDNTGTGLHLPAFNKDSSHNRLLSDRILQLAHEGDSPPPQKWQ